MSAASVAADGITGALIGEVVPTLLQSAAASSGSSGKITFRPVPHMRIVLE
jgi:hypothetical protein